MASRSSLENPTLLSSLFSKDRDFHALKFNHPLQGNNFINRKVNDKENSTPIRFVNELLVMLVNTSVPRKEKWKEWISDERKESWQSWCARSRTWQKAILSWDENEPNVMCNFPSSYSRRQTFKCRMQPLLPWHVHIP